jgi:Ni,Fe-hydrogenase I small subunit
MSDTWADVDVNRRHEHVRYQQCGTDGKGDSSCQLPGCPYSPSEVEHPQAKATMPYLLANVTQQSRPCIIYTEEIQSRCFRSSEVELRG